MALNFIWPLHPGLRPGLGNPTGRWPSMQILRLVPRFPCKFAAACDRISMQILRLVRPAFHANSPSRARHAPPPRETHFPAACDRLCPRRATGHQCKFSATRDRISMQIVRRVRQATNTTARSPYSLLPASTPYSLLSTPNHPVPTPCIHSLPLSSTPPYLYSPLPYSPPLLSTPSLLLSITVPPAPSRYCDDRRGGHLREGGLRAHAKRRCRGAAQ